MNAKDAEKAFERAAAVEAMVGHILDMAAGTPSGFVHVTPCAVNDEAIATIKACSLLSYYWISSAYGKCPIPSHYYQIRQDLPEEWDKEQRANLKATCQQKTRAAAIAFSEAAHAAGLKIENRPANPAEIDKVVIRIWAVLLVALAGLGTVVFCVTVFGQGGWQGWAAGAMMILAWLLLVVFTIQVWPD